MDSKKNELRPNQASQKIKIKHEPVEPELELRNNPENILNFYRQKVDIDTEFFFKMWE